MTLQTWTEYSMESESFNRFFSNILIVLELLRSLTSSSGKIWLKTSDLTWTRLLLLATCDFCCHQVVLQDDMQFGTALQTYYLTLHNTRHTWHMTSTDIVMFTSFTITPATKDSLFWSWFPSTRTQIPPSFRWYLVPFRAWHPGIGAQARQGWVRDGPWPIRPGLVFSFVLGFSQDAYVAVRWVSSFWNDWCTDETMPIF